MNLGGIKPSGSATPAVGQWQKIRVHVLVVEGKEPSKYWVLRHDGSGWVLLTDDALRR